MLKAMAAAAKPSVHLGNMTFAWSQASTFVNDAIAKQMMDAFVAGSGVFFDTARIYANGKSEEMTGRIISKSPAKYAGLSVATKAHPSQPGGLSEEGIRGQLKASLEVGSRVCHVFLMKKSYLSKSASFSQFHFRLSKCPR